MEIPILIKGFHRSLSLNITSGRSKGMKADSVHVIATPVEPVAARAIEDYEINPPNAAVNINEAAAFAYLRSHNFPIGLIKAYIDGLKKRPIRFFIIDDSGSMSTNDGKMLIDQKNVVKCSRWNELCTTIKFHVLLAHEANAPTEFRFLNLAEPILIGNGDSSHTNCDILMDILNNESPNGGTPLCKHIREIVAVVKNMEQSLIAHRQRVSLIIATDGESSDGNIAEVLKPLEFLKCDVIIRLCTDQDSIVDYWNNIDSDLELSIDVLDDIFGEAKEVERVNPWLNYCAPLHRFRESGILLQEFDMLDEGALSTDQMKNFLAILFNRQDYPMPQLHWKQFESAVTQDVDNSLRYFSANLKVQNKKIISVTTLRRMYSPNNGGCTIM